MHPSDRPLDHPIQETSPPWSSQTVTVAPAPGGLGGQASLCQWARLVGGELGRLPFPEVELIVQRCVGDHTTGERKGWLLGLKFPSSHHCETVTYGSAETFSIFTSPAKCTVQDSPKQTFPAMVILYPLLYFSSSPTPPPSLPSLPQTISQWTKSTALFRLSPVLIDLRLKCHRAHLWWILRLNSSPSQHLSLLQAQESASLPLPRCSPQFLFLTLPHSLAYILSQTEAMC